MIKLKDARLIDGIPGVIAKQSEAQALSYAMGKLTDKLLSYADKLSIYCGVDTLTSDMLDALALELNIPRYSTSYTVDQKRQLIKDAMSLRATSGTAKAVENICNLIFGDAKVTEWFEYGAQPGYFKVSTTNPEVSAENIEEFKKTAKSVSRLSQHLDSVELLLAVVDDIYVCVIARTGTQLTLYCDAR